jgi:hypothetical protein
MQNEIRELVMLLAKMEVKGSQPRIRVKERKRMQRVTRRRYESSRRRKERRRSRKAGN